MSKDFLRGLSQSLGQSADDIANAYLKKKQQDAKQQNELQADLAKEQAKTQAKQQTTQAKESAMSEGQKAASDALMEIITGKKKYISQVPPVDRNADLSQVQPITGQQYQYERATTPEDVAQSLSNPALATAPKFVSGELGKASTRYFAEQRKQQEQQAKEGTRLKLIRGLRNVLDGEGDFKSKQEAYDMASSIEPGIAKDIYNDWYESNTKREYVIKPSKIAKHLDREQVVTYPDGRKEVKSITSYRIPTANGDDLNDKVIKERNQAKRRIKLGRMNERDASSFYNALPSDKQTVERQERLNNIVNKVKRESAIFADDVKGGMTESSLGLVNSMYNLAKRNGSEQIPKELYSDKVKQAFKQKQLTPAEYRDLADLYFATYGEDMPAISPQEAMQEEDE